MSSTDRQNRLLLTEDWKRIYESFRNADFKSYDFDSLRRTLINYLRENYPEDFNDYIESSEYLALIDMIAFLGQNLAFRTDLNARENYIDLAERRESVLRLARLLSYNPKRNQAANGLLKVTSITATETVRDSNNISLANRTISWNDPTNPNWQEQFERVLNAALPQNSQVGNPQKREFIQGLRTEKYKIRSANPEVPVFGFNKAVDGRAVQFEVTSADITPNNIVEEPPLPGNSLGFLFRNDGQGPESANTGYFCHFRQGTLDQGDFTIDNPVANQTVNVDAQNINNTDVFLYEINLSERRSQLWTKVEATTGNNVIFNSLDKNIRKIYAVTTRPDDRIGLVFADGTFGEIPNGRFRVYYRTSINSPLQINPDDLRNINVSIPYVSRTGQAETITFTLGLQQSIDNSARSESTESIKRNAPALFYTQNRMITGEDYQIAPLTISQEIVKAKSINRTSSGVSRFFDLVDSTGKYSTVNLFGTDGALYKVESLPQLSFGFSTLTDIEGAILTDIEPVLGSTELNNYYLDTFPKIFIDDLGGVWNQTTADTNQSTGFIQNERDILIRIAGFTQSNFKFLKTDSLIKFTAPPEFYFLNGELVPGIPDFRGGDTKIWAKIVSIRGDGTEVEDDRGPILLNQQIPTGAILSVVIPALPNALTAEASQQLVDQIFSFRTFGLRFDRNSGEWAIITQTNLNTTTEFSTGKTGDNSNQNLDASWFLLFENDGEAYTVTHRSLRYIFESDKEIRFFFDEDSKNFNPKSGRVQKDKISVLPINTKPDTSEPLRIQYDWEIISEFRDIQGYIDSKKLVVGFFDADDDGVVDNPETFEDIVNEEVNPLDKLVFLKLVTSPNGINDYVYTTKEEINVKIFQARADIGPLSQYDDRQLFYFFNENVFEVFNRNTVTLELTSDFKAEIGIDLLKFQYVHSTGQNQRIDPSSTNIIDTHLLTRQYDRQFRRFLQDVDAQEPLPPSSDALFVQFGQQLNRIKSISDEIIYHPVRYKPLFGRKARPELQAKFKIVKNRDQVINDNDLKSRTISAINGYFSIDSWDFGDTFYFSELAAYVVTELSPDLASFVIVPAQLDQSFGSLFEIKSESDEIFISAATVADIEIIDKITANRLRASGSIITESEPRAQGIQSMTSLSSPPSTSAPLSSPGSPPSTSPPSSPASPPSTPPSTPPPGGGIRY